MARYNKEKLEELFMARLRTLSGEAADRCYKEWQQVRAWDPETGELPPVDLTWLTEDQMREIAGEVSAGPPAPSLKPEPTAAVEASRVEEVPSAGPQIPAGAPGSARPGLEEELGRQLQLLRTDLDRNPSSDWRRIRVRAEEIARQATGELQEEAQRLANEAGRKLEGEVGRLKDKALRAGSFDEKIELYRQILALEPDDAWVRKRLIALDIEAGESEVRDGAHRAVEQLNELLDRLGAGEPIRAEEVHQAILQVERAQSWLDPEADRDLIQVLDRFIEPARREWDRLREEEGVRVTEKARGLYAKTVRDYDKLIRQDPGAQVVAEDGKPFPVTKQRERTVEEWRAFVGGKISEKEALAERQRKDGYPNLALNHITEAIALLDEFMEVTRASHEEEKKRLEELKDKKRRYEDELTRRKEAQFLVQQAAEEKDGERRLALLRRAEAQYSDFPGLEADIARTETTLANIAAAEVWAGLAVLRGELRLAQTLDEVARVRQRRGDLLVCAQKGFESESLQGALRELEQFAAEIERTAEYLRQVQEVETLLAGEPPAVNQALNLVDTLRPRFPEREGDLVRLKIRLQGLGDDRQKLEAARGKLEVEDNPDQCLDLLSRIDRPTPESRRLRQRAELRRLEKEALEARRRGEYDEAQACYEAAGRLAPERAGEFQLLSQETRRERDLVTEASQAAERGDFKTACQRQEEAQQLRQDRFGIDPRLDQYRLQWRNQVLNKMHAWLQDERSERWDSMLGLVRTAHTGSLLLNAEDQHLADRVRIRALRCKFMEAQPSGDRELMEGLVNDFSTLLTEEFDLRGDFELHYKLASLYLFMFNFDDCRRYISKCRHLLQAGRLGPRAYEAITPGEAAHRRRQEQAPQRLDALQQELDEAQALREFYNRAQARVSQADIDGMLVEQMIAARESAGRLRVTGELLQQDLRNLADQAVRALLQAGAGLDHEGPTVEGLQRYQWAQQLLKAYAARDGKQSSTTFLEFEVTRAIQASAREFPRLVARHCDARDAFLDQLKMSREGIPIKDACERSKLLLEQARALKQVQGEGRLSIPRGVSLEQIIRELESLVTNLDALREAVHNVQKLYDRARSGGDLADEQFDRVEAALKRVRQRCREELLNGEQVYIREVEELNRRLHERLEEMVKLPIRDGEEVRPDQPVTSDQIDLPDPAAGDGRDGQGPRWRMVHIGELDHHRILVKLGINLQQAWAQEEFALVQRIADYMVQADPQDRYKIQAQLTVLDGHEGRPVEVKGLPTLTSRLEAKRKNLQEWERLSQVLREQWPARKKEWEEVKGMAAPQYTLEERLSKVEGYVKDLEEFQRSLNIPASADSIKAEEVRDNQVNPQLAFLRDVLDEAARRHERLEKELGERSEILEKLVDGGFDNDRERLCVRARELDPTHPTVQALCSSDRSPKRPTPPWHKRVRKRIQDLLG